MKNALLVAALMLVGCGVAQTEVTETDVLDSEGSELSTTSRTYVTFTRDFRKCVSPMCGGWWVTDVNRVNPTAKYVNALDFSKSKLDEATIAKAMEGEVGEVVLRGKLGAAESRFDTRPFVVTDAWRGMPGVTAVTGQPYFKVEHVDIQCIKAPCPTMKATKVNAGGAVLIDGVKVEDAALTLVDQVWLTSRVTGRDAIVTAKFVNGAFISGSYEKVLSASQVFVKLPESPGPCPLARPALCAAGKVRNTIRTENRCELPGVCVIPGACALFVPNCAEGYSLQAWSGGQFACTVYACDRAFSL